MAQTHKEWPKTVEEAVNQILSSMHDKDKEIIKNIPKEDLTMLCYSWGPRIRNEFGLWGSNEELLASCGSINIHPDVASMVIIKAVYKKLQEK